MARLIDPDAIIDFIDMGHYRNPLETCFSERDVVDMLESAPTVDAVPVVRCRDCKHWDVRPINGRCTLGKCLKLSRVMGDTSFCSYGERKDGDHDA